tara:strand:+ start:253 stop:438 length:186 start_codon:yes stop_codon:yes gene_type:complete
MDIETLKSASQFFVRYNINTFVEDGKIYVDMGDCELELSDAEVKFRARCNDELKERMKKIN